MRVFFLSISLFKILIKTYCLFYRGNVCNLPWLAIRCSPRLRTLSLFVNWPNYLGSRAHINDRQICWAGVFTVCHMGSMYLPWVLVQMQRGGANPFGTQTYSSPEIEKHHKKLGEIMDSFLVIIKYFKLMINFSKYNL